ncbi:hypothetical protein AC579_10480 [Pseudocercospora musae]|uniref:Uncharacterized protein n=1 Tax=Pseudocercospora musae TaxID=113226 RepID=A0A139I4E6_9PEZI|nr:hypothetical protein AC579_10480 [Pseudocercospora musae]
MDGPPILELEHSDILGHHALNQAKTLEYQENLRSALLLVDCSPGRTLRMKMAFIGSFDEAGTYLRDLTDKT